ncbi:hypothetical protein AMATHDRAFT_61952 [Amanita thiersii Skay4041]|uniref:Aldose 1-epimerase n=1 Tax=Amanita thiersii Skay4041 TaxID=703135 RepID=A0A2A9NQS2_9AGAR|nr:hypothetical protein AMATHDRAFT_61952 [Amanita thiersii Skay4041]
MSNPSSVLLSCPDSDTTPVSIEILPRGLTIHRFNVWVGGQTHDIVVGPELPEGHLSQKYTNTVIGRYTNRIPVGNHVLEKQGITSNFAAQPNENSRVSLHGGPTGFDSVTWKLLNDSKVELFTQTELSEISTLGPASYAFFRLESPDGDQGYPGKLVVEALIAITPPTIKREAHSQEVKLGSVVLVYRARLAEDKKMVTPVNLTQHWGFNLDASSSPGRLSVKEHTLTIKADRYAELDEYSLPTGTFKETAGDEAHFHSSKKIGSFFPEKGYDDYYIFQDRGKLAPSIYPLNQFTRDTDLISGIIRPIETNRPVVELASSLSGKRLAFFTNQQGVMFYSNNLANPSSGARKVSHGGSGKDNIGDAYTPGSAAFLEFHNPLATFMFPKSEERDDTLLTSEEIYHNFVRCDVYSKETH